MQRPCGRNGLSALQCLRNSGKCGWWGRGGWKCRLGVGDRTGPQRGEGRGPTGRSGWQLGLEPRSVALRLASSWLKSGPIPTEGPWPSLAAPTGSPGRTGPGGGGRKVRGGGRASQTGGFGKPGGGAGAAAWPAGDPVAQLRGGEPRRELVASRNGVTPPACELAATHASRKPGRPHIPEITVPGLPAQRQRPDRCVSQPV